MKKQYKSIALVCLLAFANSCTNLDEQILKGKYVVTNAGGTSNLDPAQTLAGAYSQLNIFANQANAYAMEEHASDEMMGPTRGTDWDDFGTWRKLHQHTWDASHNQVSDTWDELNIGSYRATQALSVATTNQGKAEARFLRAFFMSYIVDLYGQVPQREANASPDDNPTVMSRSAATSFIIEDLKFAAANLASGAAGVATKEAANALLAKMYLNKAVYGQDVNSPAGPFTFAKADMDAVIAACDAVIASGKYTIQPAGTWYKNFYWDNTTDSKELIFVRQNEEGNPVASVKNRSFMGLHYNQQPSGWNGFTTLADFYNGFEKSDERLGGKLAGFTDKIGTNFGFLVGQQYAGDGVTKIKDRSGNPLIFTPDVNLNYATESKGIRVIKFPLKPISDGAGGYKADENSGNDYIFLRYSDVLLMKAEAILRGGTPTGGDTKESLVNKLRAARGLTALATVDAKAMLLERGHELYYEGCRRTDQIRFGTFNDPVDQRSSKSAAFRVVYPIPQRAVDTNPNLAQNKGY